MNRSLATPFCLLAIFFGMWSGDAASRILNIRFTSDHITIDGVLDEKTWKTAETLSGLQQNEPEFGEPATLKTVVRTAYNKKMLYFAVECEDPETAEISAGASRDGAIGNDDSIVIVLDTFNDKNSAYVFAVNSLGTQFDARIFENGRSWELEWNGGWDAACTIGGGGWNVEIGIPFDEIAFDKDTEVMGFNVVRNIPRNHEEAFLVLIPSNRWAVSEFGEIVNFDLSGVESKNYKINYEAHFAECGKHTSNLPATDTYVLKDNLFYKSGSNLSDYEKERCFLDLYLPKGSSGFPVMVWFHGGSLERCSKDDYFTQDLAKHFAANGVAVAAVNYRLSPNVGYPSYVEDAAASVAWVIAHVGEYGGDANSVFLAGHSAGGYLTYMLGMDRKYLSASGIAIDRIAGLVPISGQTFTHYTIRKERGIADPENTPVIDDASPCYHAQKSGVPILVVCGDGDPQDRIEENHYFLALLKKVGYTNAEYREMKNRNHWDLVMKIPAEGDPLSEAVLAFIARHSRSAE